MKSTILWCLFLVLSICGVNAQEYTLSGTIQDDQQQSLEAATIFTETLADSTLINYAITDASGNFELAFKTKKPKVRVVVNYNGYETYRKELNLTTSEIALGSISLKPLAVELDGVDVVADAAPIVVKADTLEYNANSFKVPPGSNVEKLLKELPEVDVDLDGSITFQGQKVNNVLVNGKPFFGSDGKIAVQNLPAALIEKVQVTTTKTTEEELSGAKAKGTEKTINLTIAEDKNKGTFGKVLAGYGTDDRYESSFLFNTFKGDRRFSVLGSSNNINSVGFSMDEVFDNMSGSRTIYRTNDTYGTVPQYGITQSNIIGMEFTDTWLDEHIEPNATYYFTEVSTDNENATSSENFQPSRTTYTNSVSTTDNYTRKHTLEGRRNKIKIDSTLTIQLDPSFKQSTGINHYTSASATSNASGDLLNDSESNSVTDVNTVSFNNKLFVYKRLAKKARGYSFSFNNSNSRSDKDLLTQSETNFYETGDPSDIRNQNSFTHTTADTYAVEVSYKEPVTDSLQLNFDVGYSFENSIDKHSTFDFDGATYTNLNAEQSSFYQSSTSTLAPKVGIDAEIGKIWMDLYIGAEFVDFKNQSLYLGTTTQLNKSYVFPSISNWWNMIKPGLSVSLRYDYTVSLPSARQLLPVTDLSNPLYITIGNPDLEATQKHRVSFMYLDYDYMKGDNYSLMINGDQVHNQVVASTVYDDANKATTTYENVSDVYTMGMSGGYTKTIKTEAGNRIRMKARLSANYRKDKGLTNEVLYESDAWSLRPNVSMSYELPELLKLEPSYVLGYTDTKYRNYLISARSNVTHTAKLETTLYWPKNVVWGNDVGYTYNSNISDGFRKDFYLWNMSLGYSFYQDKFLFKVKVYDLLDQNLSATRRISATAITDASNVVLQRYVMFSLTYNLKMSMRPKRKSRVIEF